MANSLYKSGLDAFAKGEIVWKALDGSTIKAILVDANKYAFSVDHATLNEIPESARVGNPSTLTLIDAQAGGVCDAEDVTFTQLTEPPTVEAIVLYKDTGVESTSPLLAYIDTGTGLPTPAGVNSVIVQWDDGPNKIFKL